MSAPSAVVVGAGPLGYVVTGTEAEGADMHPEEIKAALRIKGITLAALADQCGVSRSMVTHVIHGYARSAHIEKRVSEYLGKPVSAIWQHKPVLRRSRLLTGVTV